ncbi:methylmalonyl-CoA mutase [Neobacillus niacini]|uniref:methylmalonyl-CoA mutase family protein n=1 Tax=Neobacillus niacini TaxID=86668 RepID=UPI00278B25E2|nr:methylmalonyl-CoA mutase family protein [Neobacillus niacini]MDQ1005367.1 methylmalonyl-CoA mutase [Neobacillus niacini]
MIINANMDEKEKLNKENSGFAEFPAPSFNEWKQAAVKALKGASFEEKLVTTTYEGIAIQPMYTKEDVIGISHLSSSLGTAPFVRGTREIGEQRKPWEVSQELPYGTPSEFNEAVKIDLTRGQTMVNLVLDRASALGKDPDQAAPECVGDKGVSISSLEDVKKALEGINLEKTPLFVQAGMVGLPVYSMIVAEARQAGMDIRQLRGCVGMDPLGTLAKEGTLPISLQKAYEWMAKLTLCSKGETPELKTILIQADTYHQAGGNAAQELAFALATGVEYIREMQNRGLSIGDVAQSMIFTFSVGSNVFLEIAKLRAARLLWSNIVASFGGKEEELKMSIHARTSSWTKTVSDPYVNILRGTAESFAAIIGGADSLHVSPFDEAVRTPDEFSRRIARNTQIILDKEAHLSKVADPAGGSWYVESLTDSLAKQAWQLFQQIEASSGMFNSLEKGEIQEQINAIANQRFTNIAHRKERLVGTNMYPNLTEKKLSKNAESVYEVRCKEVRSYRETASPEGKETLLQRLGAEQNLESFLNVFRQRLTIGEVMDVIHQNNPDVPSIQALPARRASEQFDSLRERAESYKDTYGFYPKVFLANLGKLAQFKPRADFATVFFEVGGFEVLSNNSFETVDQAVQATVESEASIVVICSHDDVYADMVPTLAGELKKMNPELTLLLAGSPSSEHAELFKQAGVDEWIHMKSNCYQVLFDLQQRKGIGQ